MLFSQSKSILFSKIIQLLKLLFVDEGENSEERIVMKKHIKAAVMVTGICGINFMYFGSS